MLKIVLLVVVASANALTDEEHSKFPRLFHLDDYDNCLAQPSGLYCVGIFNINPTTQPHTTYELMKEYSKASTSFNRTLLHRGYCISSRCSSLSETNTSLRFEQCAGQWAKKNGYRLSLQKLHYCRSHAQEYARKNSPEPMDEPQKLLLYVVYAFLALNFLGTAYDLMFDDDSKKSKHLVSWSIRSNWHRLTATYEDGDPRLSALNPVQGVRVFLMTLTILTHSGCIPTIGYVFNPRYIEDIIQHPAMMLFLNGTTMIHIFLMMSNFLVAYNLLIVSKTHELRMKHLPLCIAKRIARISPVYLLVVGYAATWWPFARSGPLWPTLVEAESNICKKKFWSQVFFVNNLVDAEEHCLVQTWFLAVDLQLHVLAATLTLYFASRREAALKVLGSLFVGSLLLIAGLTYAFDWKALVDFVTPENLRDMYLTVPSFARLYMSPWGCLPACFAGLFLAYLHFELQERGYKKGDMPQLVKTIYQISPLLLTSWLVYGPQLGMPAWVYVPLERFIISAVSAFILFGMIVGENNLLKDVFAWRGWHAMGRMSLSVLMVHWCINSTIVYSRPQPSTVSILDVFVDFTATGVFSYIAAVPLTLLVEMPAQRFISGLIL